MERTTDRTESDPFPAPLESWEVLLALAGLGAGWWILSQHVGQDFLPGYFSNLTILLIPLALAPFVLTDFLLQGQARLRGRDRLALLIPAVTGWSGLWHLATGDFAASIRSVFVVSAVGTLAATIFALTTWKSAAAPARSAWNLLAVIVPGVWLLAFLATV